MSLEKLNQKAGEFNPPQEIIDKREADRFTFIEKFPLEKIQDLSIEQYVQGTDKDSFCYWLEFKKILFGIGGGNASKFGLYKAKDGNYYTSSGKNKRQLVGTELNDFFENIKSGILLALKYVENDEIEKIRSIETPIWNMVLQKILTLYYPDKFLTVGASSVLIECAKDIKIEGVEIEPGNLIQINYEIKKALINLPEYKDWSYERIGSFIWQSYLDDSRRDYYILGSKYSGNVDVFPKMLDEKAIAVGFASHLNLEEYYGKNALEFKEYLTEQGEGSSSCNALKHFLTLKAGDRIAIKADGSPKGNKGFLSIVGIAQVIEKDGEIYWHEPDGLGHRINVKFIKAPVYREFDLGGYGRTIHKLSKSEHIDLIFKSDYTIVDIDAILKDHKEEFTKWLSVKYGENSGTISSYVKAIDILSDKLERKIFKSTDDQFLSELYTDLIKEQGSPDSKYLYEGAPSYGNNGFYSASIKSYREFLKSIKHSKIELNKEKMNFPLNTILYGPPGTGKTYNTILKAAQIIENRKIDSHKEALEIFKSNLHNRIEFITFHQNYSYEDFIQGLRPETDNKSSLVFEKKDGVFKKIADRALENIENPEKVERQNYVIIIDEINRANISRVFGELITLIEPDKRSHGDIPLEARLPSGDPFIVPSNLFIIGTMNTADKSIALLDIALRRRFEFEAVYPKYEIKDEEIYDVEILQKINERIIESKGHDFQIGHAYFMGENKDLLERMNKKVIPLLLEYYMNDKKEVEEILKSAGLKIEAKSWPLKITGKND